MIICVASGKGETPVHQIVNAAEYALAKSRSEDATVHFRPRCPSSFLRSRRARDLRVRWAKQCKEE